MRGHDRGCESLKCCLIWFNILFRLVDLYVQSFCSTGGQCLEREVLVAHGSVAVLPCVDESSVLSYPTAVYWSRMNGK